ncbi:two-component response regulator ARR5 isoform X1 [Ziziphus jujuba]|uniref:Two-component response regulator ARR5 isoform X1 n=2 Tax=Ziziphus jujuba TaxID=326968 RepID=A0A6P3ZVA7_ZIZJJ|nr:two-component response regulator ARR5 isoform X1 [Ziziphus jujuba]KAH7515787.1 hypothetical protein FEM48_Zijuj10G0063500 [Ziziphus jujuba var. spinosa]
MARNGFVSRWRRSSERVNAAVACDVSPPHVSDEVHVLAVDDSFVDRKVIERLLRISSCKVTAVDSGRRALQFLGLDDEKSSPVDFHSLKVDLIITDYCMPGMTGYELLKKIKESSTFKEIPVVIMSSENVLARIDRCLEEGAEDFIVKPVKLADVKRIKDFMTTRVYRFGNEEEEESGGMMMMNKRKLQDSLDLSSSSSPPQSISPSSSSLSSSPSSSLSSPSSPTPSSSGSTLPSSSLSAPSSPISLDSPIRRLKTTITD